MNNRHLWGRWLTLLAALLLLAACGGSGSNDGSGGGGATDPDVDPPGGDEPPVAGPAPAESLKLFASSGRSAVFRDEGFGGELSITNRSGGDIVITADPVHAPKTDFVSTEIAAVPMDFGERPLIVEADLMLDLLVGDPADKPPAGTLYMGDFLRSGPRTLRRSDGDLLAFNDEEVITGIHVMSGATLSLPRNRSREVLLANDVLIEGRLTSSPYDAARRGMLWLSAANVYLASGGVLDMAGTAASGEGGRVDMRAPSGRIISAGVITSSGLDDGLATRGGLGGDIVLFASMLEQRGSLLARGGNGSGTRGGGPGGDVSLEASGDLLMSGVVAANGGASESANAGDGGDLFLGANGGDILLSADIDLSGPRDGGTMTVDVVGGRLQSTATINLAGVDQGGSMYVLPASRSTTEPGSAVLGGRLDLSGATGGRLIMEIDERDSDQGSGFPLGTAQPLILYVSDIQMHGGDERYGGHGGNLTLMTLGVEAAEAAEPIGGDVVVDVAINARGGNASGADQLSGVGGTGGEVFVGAYNTGPTEPLPERTRALISAIIDVSGGDSFNAVVDENVNTGGDITVESSNQVLVSGALITRGGNDFGAAGVAADGGAVSFYGDRGLDVSEIDGSGGDGAVWGGDGSTIRVDSAAGRTVSLQGRLNGGNADPLLAGSQGGATGTLLINPFNFDLPVEPGLFTLNFERQPGSGETSREAAPDAINGGR